ncbi:MAG: PilZ domain-containing protein [Oryzomonas sp.]|uniref:PilZ domain-containing protein n=1 Tax=Oryzomonas sp. TaxID=2855186 RepID=UPI0028456E10|nr:PilZ domain-containing protein [Oryzomonas sp.]MDR3578671.1 PilZ domain-containing protein [Oryzomonas sp.]
MANQRFHIRLECKERCHLHLRDSFYPARAENISLGGVLVHFDDSIPGFYVGDNCKLVMDGLQNYEYLCEIARVEAADVALRFVGMHITT